MKAANKCIRKHDTAGLAAIGWTPEQIEKAFEPDFAGRVGSPRYMLSNNNANMKRIKTRIEQLEAAAQRTNQTIEKDGYQVIQNVDENRVQFVFPGKPGEKARKILKSHAFRWAPSQNAWQRKLTNAAIYSAKLAIKELDA